MSYEAHKIQQRLIPPEYQTPATLNQAAPVQNTWYDILPTTTNVRVWKVAVAVEDTNETLQVQIIIDGETIEGAAFPCNHSTSYIVALSPSGVLRVDRVSLLAVTAGEYAQGGLIDGRSVQIQLRKTTAAGVGNLSAIAMYSRYTPVDV